MNEINIAALERRFRALLRDFKRSGEGLDETPPSQRAAPVLTAPLKSIMAAGAILVVILALLALPVGGAPPEGGPAAVPSPRPPLGGDGGGGGGGGGGDGGLQSAIFGTVIDLNTGQPGAAIEVSVSGFPPVRTDGDGSFSVTGLPAGEYSISLALQGQGAPAQGPIFISVDGQNSTTVDLGYYSLAQPLPTDTPQPPAAPPPAMPNAGAPFDRRLLVVAGLGLVLALLGIILRLAGRNLT